MSRRQEFTDTCSGKLGLGTYPWSSPWASPASVLRSHSRPRPGSGQVSREGPAHPLHSRLPQVWGGAGSPLGAGKGKGRLSRAPSPTAAGGLIQPGRAPSGCSSCPGPGYLKMRGQRTKSFSSLGGRNGGQSQGQGLGENSNRAFCCPRTPRLGLQPSQAFPLGNILSSASPVGGVQEAPLTRKSCQLDGARGRPRSVEASGPGTVVGLLPLSSSDPQGNGKGSCRCGQHPLALFSWGAWFWGPGERQGHLPERAIGIGGGVPGKGLFEEPRDGGERVCPRSGAVLGQEEWRAESTGPALPHPLWKSPWSTFKTGPGPRERGRGSVSLPRGGEGVALLGRLGCTLPRNAGRGTPAWVMEPGDGAAPWWGEVKGVRN